MRDPNQTQRPPLPHLGSSPEGYKKRERSVAPLRRGGFCGVAMLSACPSSWSVWQVLQLRTPLGPRRTGMAGHLLPLPWTSSPADRQRREEGSERGPAVVFTLDSAIFIGPRPLTVTGSPAVQVRTQTRRS